MVRWHYDADADKALPNSNGMPYVYHGHIHHPAIDSWHMKGDENHPILKQADIGDSYRRISLRSPIVKVLEMLILPKSEIGLAACIKPSNKPHHQRNESSAKTVPENDHDDPRPVEGFRVTDKPLLNSKVKLRITGRLG